MTNSSVIISSHIYNEKVNNVILYFTQLDPKYKLLHLVLIKIQGNKYGIEISAVL